MYNSKGPTGRKNSMPVQKLNKFKDNITLLNKSKLKKDIVNAKKS